MIAAGALAGVGFSRAAEPSALVIPSPPQSRLRSEEERGICVSVDLFRLFRGECT